jgi:hypothetical protein
MSYYKTFYKIEDYRIVHNQGVFLTNSKTPSTTNSKPNRSNIFSNIKDFFHPQPFEIYDLNTEHKANISDYLKFRFKPQVDWYEKHALSNMQKFYFCQVLIIVVGASIPIINVFGIGGLTNDNGIRIWSSVLGGTITILTGFLQLTKAHENWILYRSTVESLKREYNLFSLDAAEYSLLMLRNIARKEILTRENCSLRE